MNLEGLNHLISQMGDEYITRVGILGAKNSRASDDDMGNADIGFIHEIGNPAANIPPRSFLRFPLELKRKDLMSAFTSAGAKSALNTGNYKKVFEILGVQAEAVIQMAFSSGGFGQWPALKPSTVKAKGSSAILIDTAELRRAVTSDVVKKSEI